MCARSTWHTHWIVASRSGLSSVEATNMVPVELRVRASWGFWGARARSPAANARSASFSSAKDTARSPRLARPLPFADCTSPHQAAVCGLRDRRRCDARRRDARERPDESSSRKESSTVDRVRTRPPKGSSKPPMEPEEGRAAGGFQQRPWVGVATSAELRPFARFARMLRSISSKNARFSASLASRASLSAASCNSRGLVHCVSRVSTS
mmetsp:Transcript_2748/g.8051  ORF Transcript_2748/g.8051 Transcript_2748/m.8051 type:complete len:210 (+) Transcript_2748:768-1397(+)